LNGGLYDIYGGLLSWVRDNVNPGKVEVQAKGDITVNSHGSDPTGPVRKSFGAIAAIATASNSPGGLVDVRSLGGSIVGNNRAFDVSGRNRNAVNFAHIRLLAKFSILLNRPGATSDFNPVVDASAPGSGDNGGVNDIRSYSGSIIVGPNALVTADAPFGNPGSNNLASCTGITITGTVVPADGNAGDNTGTCGQATPDAIYTDLCPADQELPSKRGVNESDNSVNVISKTGFLKTYPNPFSQSTTVSYELGADENVTIKVFSISGKEVATLQNGNQHAGSYNMQWNAVAFPAGVYVVQMKAGTYTGMNKLMLIK